MSVKECLGKTVSASRTEQAQILMYDTLNGYKRLFGGRLMEWIDVVAAVVARRHSGCAVTTASVDTLTFTAPAYVDDTVILQGYITHAGRTSMEICVRTFVENLDGSRREINRAYLVMVALDENGKPAPVPALKLETDEERAEWEAAIRRRDARKHN
jgi:acyl-CoA hydrolase